MTTFALSDAEYETATSADVSPLRCQQDGCTNSVTKPARGRTPLYCDDHRRSSGKLKSSTPRSTARWAEADTVKNALSGYLELLGSGVMLINPVDGRLIAAGAEPIAAALVDLGRQDKAWRTWLERVSRPGKYGPLIAALSPIVIGVMANHNLIPQLVIPNLNGKGE